MTRELILENLKQYIETSLSEHGYEEYLVEITRNSSPSHELLSKLPIEAQDYFSPHLCFVYEGKIGVVSLFREPLTIMSISKSRLFADLCHSDLNLIITTVKIPTILKRYFDKNPNSPLLKFDGGKKSNIGYFDYQAKMINWYLERPQF